MAAVNGHVTPPGGAGRRFATLSSLPAARRIPARRDVPAARHQRENAQAAAAAAAAAVAATVPEVTVASPVYPGLSEAASRQTLPEAAPLPILPRAVVSVALSHPQAQAGPPAHALQMQVQPAWPQPQLQPPPAAMLPAVSARQLGFNCPACFTVLIIKDPTTYDGRPAPCPTCGIRILPPQRVPESPFQIVHRAPQAQVLPMENQPRALG